MSVSPNEARTHMYTFDLDSCISIQLLHGSQTLSVPTSSEQGKVIHR